MRISRTELGELVKVFPHITSRDLMHNKLKIYDNNYLITDYEVYYNIEDEEVEHHLTIDAQISDETDLVLFLKEEQFDTGDINTTDYYQFNNYGMQGVDLIDLIRGYDI